MSVLTPTREPVVSPVFGRILSTTAVERRVIAHLKVWHPTYLAEIERQEGLEPASIAQPRGWTTRTRLDKWASEQMPLVVVACPGLGETPEADGEDSYRSEWEIALGVYCSGQDQEHTRALCGLHLAALRAIVVQHPSLGGWASCVDWTDEALDLLDEAGSATLFAGRCVITVGVSDTTTRRSGPRAPLDNPYAAIADPPVVDTVIVGAGAQPTPIT